MAIRKFDKPVIQFTMDFVQLVLESMEHGKELYFTDIKNLVCNDGRKSNREVLRRAIDALLELKLITSKETRFVDRRLYTRVADFKIDEVSKIMFSLNNSMNSVESIIKFTCLKDTTVESILTAMHTLDELVLYTDNCGRKSYAIKPALCRIWGVKVPEKLLSKTICTNGVLKQTVKLSECENEPV